MKDKRGRVPCYQYTYRFVVAALVVLLTILPLQACRPQETPTTASAKPPTNVMGAPPEMPVPPREDLSPLSQAQAIRFERMSGEDGLSQNTILSIHQDQRGFMWFGTEDGLNKYDGYHFSVYKHDPDDPTTLSDNFVSAIYEDRNGTLWIGTRSGLDRLEWNTGAFVHYQHDPDDPASLGGTWVVAIYQDSQGDLWIGTEDGGLDLWDRDTETFAHYQHDPDDAETLSHNSITAIYQDRSGVLWVGTADGLDRFDPETGRTEHVELSTDTPPRSGKVLDILEDHSGWLWVSTENAGLYRLDLASGTFSNYRHDPNDAYALSHNRVPALYEDSAGRFWVGTQNGLDLYDRERERFVHYRHNPGDPYSLSSNAIWSIYEDRGGVLWFGTYGGGLSKHTRATDQFRLYQHNPNTPSSLSDNMVWSIYEDRSGALWIGTFNGGLNRLDPGTHTFSVYRHDPEEPTSLSNDDVRAIIEDRAGNLWVGTSSGLDRLDRSTETFTHYQHDPGDPASLSGTRVIVLLEDQAGNLWAGTRNEGLNRFNSETETFIRYQHDPDDPTSLSDNRVWSLYEDRSGAIWVGTLDGINVWDPSVGSFVRYVHDPSDPQSVGSNQVFSFYQDETGIMWVGTWGSGLDRFDPDTGTFSHYTEKDGLPDSVIYGIEADAQGNLWLSTNKGLSRLDPIAETFQNYDVSDGLQDNEFNVGAHHKSESGELFFGGIRGLNAFYPQQVKNNSHVPQVVITAFYRLNEIVQTDLSAGEHIELSYHDKLISFEFAALDYTSPDKNQYAYMLEGQDQDWVYAGTRRHVDYTNLGGGNYVFRVKASNNDGIWNEQGVAISLTVKPPFWVTWWFRGLVVLALVGGAAGAYGWRIKNVEARSRALQAQVEERTREIEQRTRELEALNAIAAVVSRSLDRQELLCNALEKTLEVTGLDAGGIYLLEESSQTLALIAHYGLSPEFVSEVDNLGVGEGFSGRVVQSGDPLVVRDLEHDARLTREIVRKAGFRSIASFPLVSRAKVLGTLTTVTVGEREFSEQDVSLLTAIGHQIGVAIENARLFEEAQIRAEELAVLNELGQALTARLDVDQVLDEAYRGASRLLDTTNFYIALYDSDDDEVIFALDVTEGEVHRHYAARRAGRGLTEHIIHSRAPLLIQEDMPKHQEEMGIDQVGPPALSWLGVPLTIGDQVLGVMAVQSYRTARAYDEHDQNLLTGIASQAAIAIQNARLFEETERRTQDLEALYSADEQLYRYLDLDQVLQALVDVAVDILQADKSSLMVWDEGHKKLVVRAARGFSPETVSQMTFAPGEGTVGQVAASGQAAVVEDTHADPQVARRITDPENIRSFMHVPIEIKGQVFGVFNADYAEPRAFGQDEMRLFTALAQRAALAIQNAQLYEQAQELAVVEERQRLARDLHDAVTQTLFSTSLIAEVLPRIWERNPEEGQRRLGEVRELTRGALAEMRTLLLELRPAALLEANLGDLLRQLGEAITGRARVPVDVQIEGEYAQMPPDIKVALYRIAQEALNNVAKHAAASQATVALRCGPSSPAGGKAVELSIADDGCGFDVKDIPPDHLGVGIMHERAEAIGAKLTIESQVGQGTKVTVLWTKEDGQ